MTVPFASRTVRTAVTWKPLTGYSMRWRTPGGRPDVIWTVSVAYRMFWRDPVWMLTVRPVGTLNSSNRT